jgi:hypothetical protein
MGHPFLSVRKKPESCFLSATVILRQKNAITVIFLTKTGVHMPLFIPVCRYSSLFVELNRQNTQKPLNRLPDQAYFMQFFTD